MLTGEKVGITSAYHVKVGSGMSGGLEAAKAFKKLKLGNFMVTRIILDKEEALEISNFCRQNKIYYIFCELLWRDTLGLCFGAKKRIKRKEFYTKKELETIFKSAGEYFLGRITLGEIGGLLYWPKDYLINRGAGDYKNLPVVKDVVKAKKVYIEFMKKVIALEKGLGESKFLNYDASMLFRYQLEAGIDIPVLELIPGDCNQMSAAVRGAVKAYNCKQWGTSIAMAPYGGVKLDTQWFKRYKTGLYFSFLGGANFVSLESGHLVYDQRASKAIIYYGNVKQDKRAGKVFGFNSTEMKYSRAILREFYQFCQIHSRPKNGPKVKIGFVHGNLDGTPGLWNKYVWGQFRGKKWLHGPAEWGWDYLDGLHHKEKWFNSYVQGEHDFSGNPPYGQYDIVPVEAPLSVLGKYSCLVFLGWNTMTEEIYQKLKTYVSSGGHLIMAVPHLSTHVDRAEEIRLYRGGNYSDLFGVVVNGKGKEGVAGVKYFNDSSLRSYKVPKWRIHTDPRFIGYMTLANVKLTSAKVLAGHATFHRSTVEELTKIPVLTENSIGKGKAFLITTWSYPGDKGMNLFMKDLLRTVTAGEQGNIRVLCSDKIRYSVYEDVLHNGARITTVYLLNADFDCANLVRLWINGKTVPSLEVPPNEMRIVYYYQGLVIIPQDKFIDLRSWRVKKHYHQIELFNLRGQKLKVYNLSNHKKSVEVNGRKTICERDNGSSLVLKRKIDPLRREFFDPAFLDEPKTSYKPTELQY